MTALTPVQALHALAGEHGVATLYRDWRGQPVEVGDDTVRAVLAAMDVDASTPEAVQESLAAERRRRRQRTIAPTVVARQGQRTEVPVRVAPGSAAGAEIRLADGGVVALNLEHGEPVQRQLVLPPDLPQGEHRLALTAGAAADLARLFVVPARVVSASRCSPCGRSGGSTSWRWTGSPCYRFNATTPPSARRISAPAAEPGATRTGTSVRCPWRATTVGAMVRCRRRRRSAASDSCTASGVEASTSMAASTARTVSSPTSTGCPRQSRY